MVNLTLKANQRARPLLHVGIAVAIAIWAAVVLCFAVNIVPLDVYWMSYYAVDYTYGFVRRGLAGELVGLAPGHWFAVTLGLRWLSTAVYLCALALIMGVVLFARRRSERRLMVAMLIPLLPFGVPFAAYSARPDLFGAAALAVFTVAIAFARSRAFALAWCAAYGFVIAALTLVHEAIGLQFALGAVLAIVVLAAHWTPGGAEACCWPSCPAWSQPSPSRRSGAMTSRPNSVPRSRITRCPTRWRPSRRFRLSRSTCSARTRTRPITTTGCAAT